MIFARPIYFVIDPFSGNRVAVGAIYGSERAPKLVQITPEAGLSGSQRLLVQLALEEIGRSPDFDELAVAAGPQIVFGEKIKLPAGVENPEWWLTRMLNPRARQAA